MRRFVERGEDWIVSSLLDSDFYKFTMGQFVFHRHRGTPVRYAFKNRTKDVHLARFVSEDDLRRQLDHVRTLRFTNSDLHYLRGTNEYSERMFQEDYLEFLQGLTLPPYHLERVDDDYRLEFSGPWEEAIYWEIPALAVVNELYYQALMRGLSRFERDIVYATGQMKLAGKIKLLKEHGKITWSDFGTRRRFSRDWQEYVVSVLRDEFSGRRQFLGTSSVWLAREYDLMPVGTVAHEPSIIITGIMHSSPEEIRASQRRVLEEWWQEYGWGLSIALPDTYGTDFFLREVFTPDLAREWKGMRQDSGDPFSWGDEKAIPFYEALDIDAREKLLVFSDGLDLDTMLKLHDHFSGRVRPTFGWGTNLTNDLAFPAISLVIKPVEACGHPLAKLSDNIAKATGDPATVEYIDLLQNNR